MERVIAIILAGGSGKRMKSSIPKQFLKLGDKPIIIYTLERFEKCNLVEGIVVVCYKPYIGKLAKLIGKYKLRKIIKVIPGGLSRQESSFIGVKNCPPRTSFVLIHDAVRPFVDSRIIKETLKAAKMVGASGTVLDVDDTMVIGKNGLIAKPIERGLLKRMQTPQAFRYDTILKAHKWALKNNAKGFTDDCTLALASGRGIKMAKGSESNIKITNKIDLLLAGEILRYTLSR